jgi:UV DNA damage endonuclease
LSCASWAASRAHRCSTSTPDFATPWDLAELLSAAPGALDVMIEAKAKDLAVEWLRVQMARIFPALAAAEERGARAA